MYDVPYHRSWEFREAMRRSVTELRSFYAAPLGRAVRTMVIRQLVNAWGDVRELDVLGIGYTTPFLEPFREKARRVIAAMPAAQGAETWPIGEPNLVCLADEYALPLPSAMFDRVLIVHGLEESTDPVTLLAEVYRVLALCTIGIFGKCRFATLNLKNA